MSDETLWEKRFIALGRITGASQEQIRQAFEDAPSEGKNKIQRWLDPQSQDFMGSGMNLSEFLQTGAIMRYRRSYSDQDREEQKRRRELIIRASHELEKIRKISLFGTLHGAISIEAIIEGDKKNLDPETLFELFFPEKGDPKREEFEALWEPFMDVIREALETWPEDSVGAVVEE